MLDMETQMPSYPNDDPIESFGTGGGTNQVEGQEEITGVIDKGLDCACGVDVSLRRRREFNQLMIHFLS
jgi:hypothetical protein